MTSLTFPGTAMVGIAMVDTFYKPTKIHAKYMKFAELIDE